MILSDVSLRAELAAGTLVIDPPPADEAIQPASIDLHLGKQLRWTFGDTMELNKREVWLSPGVFILAHTAEHVTIPRHLVAQLNGKSSLGRLGLAIHITAGFIDPGFSGQITLELHNYSQDAVRLDRGMPIGQLVLMRLTAPAERPYGSAGLGSHYQGQTGATPSAVTRAA
ncbi:dCTP deaminase [Roseateles sp.]|uniref:dCTP deaminase n=1 Tax=Roseateles sp. TaxID=1971397 RepID=UPI002F41ACD0